MKSLEFGWYDYNSIGEDIKGRQVIGTNPKICKYSDIEFAHIETKSKSGMGGYIRSDKGMSLDNARDIIKMINQLKKDVKKYCDWGIVKNEPNICGRIHEDNFYKVAIKCENKIDELKELL